MIDVDGQTETKYYYHFDGLGSVIALSNENKEVVEEYSYDVFGEPDTTSSIGNPYMFTGRRYDEETALYYYRARYYAYDIGRFLQTDPIGYKAGLNLYTYVGNNSVNWVDPAGLTWYAPHPGFYPKPRPKPEPPPWHKYRNRLNRCPKKEPKPGQVDECDSNPNPWKKEGWNPFHPGQQCYRRKDSFGPGGSQCCYKNGKLVGGSYDIWQPSTRWYSPRNWFDSARHAVVDIWPSIRWGPARHYHTF